MPVISGFYALYAIDLLKCSKFILVCHLLLVLIDRWTSFWMSCLPTQKKNTSRRPWRPLAGGACSRIQIQNNHWTLVSRHTCIEIISFAKLFVVDRCTVNDLKMIVRLIKHDLRINAGPKHMCVITVVWNKGICVSAVVCQHVTIFTKTLTVYDRV